MLNLGFQLEAGVNCESYHNNTQCKTNLYTCLKLNGYRLSIGLGWG
ncbi:hypothetical protein Hanom_Chr01g00003581 [Helianthus anomalus]